MPQCINCLHFKTRTLEGVKDIKFEKDIDVYYCKKGQLPRPLYTALGRNHDDHDRCDNYATMTEAYERAK